MDFVGYRVPFVEKKCFLKSKNAEEPYAESRVAPRMHGCYNQSTCFKFIKKKILELFDRISVDSSVIYGHLNGSTINKYWNLCATRIGKIQIYIQI